ncbi:MAG: response regulator [Sedimentisphaerales bacterium]|nr:response regulator [Sedimentisphaerales bacterium]
MKILVAEDDLASRKLMHKYLSCYGDCDIASDGKVAIEAFRCALDENAPYDLICLDIMMPNKDGHAALNTIRKIEDDHGIGGFDSVKVIMTTALSDSENIMGSFREGCKAYLIKPIEKNKLLKEMSNLGLIKFAETSDN